VRIAKSSKEQDGYEAPDTTGARLSQTLMAPGCHHMMAMKKLKRLVLVSRGPSKFFRLGLGPDYLFVD